jgi:hypothetical protein
MVMANEKRTTPISTDVKKMWKVGLVSFCQASGNTPAPERPKCPCRSARGAFQGCGPRTAALRQRGIVSDWLVEGKRKMCEGMHRRSQTLHNFSTSTKVVHFSGSSNA